MRVPLETLAAALRVRDARYLEVVRSLEDPANFQDPRKIGSLQKEKGLLQEFHDLLPELERISADRAEAEALVAESPNDKEMRALLESVEQKETELRGEAEDL